MRINKIDGFPMRDAVGCDQTQIFYPVEHRRAFDPIIVESGLLGKARSYGRPRLSTSTTNGNTRECEDIQSKPVLSSNAIRAQSTAMVRQFRARVI
jgi:hypothetical protein